jgi:hypothetical protein
LSDTDKKTTEVRINVKKRDKYLKDKATAIDLLFKSLGDDD